MTDVSTTQDTAKRLSRKMGERRRIIDRAVMCIHKAAMKHDAISRWDWIRTEVRHVRGAD
jgi:hypothetical protein